MDKHDYEPDHDSKPHPMHSDPPCGICGQPKTSPVHR